MKKKAYQFLKLLVPICQLAAYVLLFAFTPNQCRAEGGFHLKVNPLLSLHDQIKQAKADCMRLGMPEECKEKLELLSKQHSDLRKHCNSKPNDFRCDALFRKRLGSVDPVEELCAKDPYADKCVRKRDRMVSRQKRMRKYCKDRPESSRCKPKIVRKKVPYIVKYCKQYPNSRTCKKRLDEERRRTDPYYAKGNHNSF